MTRSGDRDMSPPHDSRDRPRAPRANASVPRAAILRGAGLAVLWLLLMPSLKVGDLAVGALAVAGATAASLRLLPPASGEVRLWPLLWLLPRFLWQSLVAGVDVARRALAPRMPLRTGFVTFRTSLPRGHARNNFATIMSLMPGTVPCGDGQDSIEFHCLDTGQPVARQMASEEQRLASVLVPGDDR